MRNREPEEGKSAGLGGMREGRRAESGREAPQMRPYKDAGDQRPQGRNIRKGGQGGSRGRLHGGHGQPSQPYRG